MGLFLGDVHFSELLRLDKPCGPAECESTIIRSLVCEYSHSVIPSLSYHKKLTL